MAESFGARLRQQRERQPIALTDIADQTKINLALLEGLERDDVSNWPRGIFRRAFVRAYAQKIGLEPDAVVREFLELYPDPVEVRPALPGSGGESVADQPPPTRLQCLVASAISSLSRFRQIVQELASQKAEITAADPGSASAPAVAEADLSTVAHLCTQFGRVLEIREVAPLLESAARILDAVGLIVWVWDPRTTALKPALAHGYPDEMLARFPKVRRDMDNATAASFRSGQTRIVNGSDLASGAVVVPLLTPAVCVGVLAVELRHGGEQKESVRALATILAAQLAIFVGSAPLAEAVSA